MPSAQEIALAWDYNRALCAEHNAKTPEEKTALRTIVKGCEKQIAEISKTQKGEEQARK